MCSLDPFYTSHLTKKANSISQYNRITEEL